MKNSTTYDIDHELHGKDIWNELELVAEKTRVFKDGSITYVAANGIRCRNSDVDKVARIADEKNFTVTDEAN